MSIERWHGSAPGRSNAVAYAGLVWTVVNARPGTVGIDAQMLDALAVMSNPVDASEGSA